MTDRELLELAAKAAGIKYDPEASKPNPVSGAWFGLWLTYNREPTEYDRRRWNPLSDDGDALRLAAKLSLSICYTLGDINAPWGTALVGFSPWENASPIAAVRYQTHEEKMAATRRAIVRAAAQIQLNKEAANE